MPTPTKGARLGGSAAHQRIILANLASQLFEHDRIVTTEARARALRPLAEKLITKAKRGDIHARRTVLTTVRDKGVVHKLFTEIAATFADRDGGYTRITKVGPRKGDNAPMALIELVTESVEQSRANHAKSSAPARTSSRSAAPAAAAATTSASAASTAQNEPVQEEAVQDGAGQDGPVQEGAGQEAPAEELVGDTETLEQATETEAAPSDDSSAEEAEAAETEEGQAKA